jgi:hypothetical protein
VFGKHGTVKLMATHTRGRSRYGTRKKFWEHILLEWRQQVGAAQQRGDRFIQGWR